MTQIQKIKRKLIHRAPKLSRLQSLRSVNCDSIVDPKTKSPSPSEGGSVFRSLDIGNSIELNKKERAKRYHKSSIFNLQFSIPVCPG